MKPVHLSCALALLASLAGPARAGVLVVAPTGAYTTIQAAVDAAVDDDVILVKSGTYPSFVVRGKSLVIAEDAGHTVLVDGAIRIGNINGTRSSDSTVTTDGRSFGIRPRTSSASLRRSPPPTSSGAR